MAVPAWLVSLRHLQEQFTHLRSDAATTRRTKRQLHRDRGCIKNLKDLRAQLLLNLVLSPLLPCSEVKGLSKEPMTNSLERAGYTEYS